MISIHINGKPLQLEPNASLELQRSNPIFSSGDSIPGEYSTPINIPYSRANASLLSLPYHFTTRRTRATYACEVFDGVTYRYKASLVIETGSGNLNNIEAGEISGFLLINISNFYAGIQGLKLRDLPIVQTVYGWTSSDPTDLSGGWWQYVHDCFTNEDSEVCFFPVRNMEGDGWINQPHATVAGQLSYDDNKDNDTLHPMPRVKFILTCIFESQGFTPDYTNLDGTGWEKLFLFSNVPAPWLDKGFTDDGGGLYTITNTPTACIFRIQDHLPPDKTVSDFLLQLSNRYGWHYIFDYDLKIVKVVALKNMVNAPVEDWTHFAEPEYVPDFSEPPVFGFGTEIDSNDTANSVPTLADFEQLPDVDSPNFLDTPSPANDGKLTLAFIDNNYYKCAYDDTIPDYAWSDAGANIGSYVPEGMTQSIDSTIGTTGVIKSIFRTEGGLDVLGYFPKVGYARGKAFGYVTLLFRMAAEVDENGDLTGDDYPYASPVATTLPDLDYLPWSNVLVHEYSTYVLGIIRYWWSAWTAMIADGERITCQFNLSRRVLRTFTWDKIVLVKNVPFLVESLNEPLPYNGPVQAVLRRLDKTAALDTLADPTPDIQITVKVASKDYNLVVQARVLYSLDDGATWTSLALEYFTTTLTTAGTFTAGYYQGVKFAIVSASYTNVSFGLFEIAVDWFCGVVSPHFQVNGSNYTMRLWINASNTGNLINCP